MIDEKNKLITRDQVLTELDIRKDKTGRKRLFSITFIKNDGKRVFVPKAYACGAGRMDNKIYRVRGIQPCDCKGNPEWHVYPVNIFRIIGYKGYKVVPNNYFDNGNTL